MLSLSQNGPSSFVTQTHSDQIVVATVDGVVVLRCEDAKWKVAFRALEGKYISSLMFEPKSKLWFAGVHRGSLFVSKDGARTWEERAKGIGHLHVFSLNYAHIEGRVKLYAGTEPAHLYESDNLGESWSELSTLRNVSSIATWTFPEPPNFAHVKNITFDPWDPRVIYVSVEQGGLFRSPDGGETWEEFPHLYNDIHRIVVLPSNPNALFVPSGDGLYSSSDYGKTWDHLTTRTMRIAYPDCFVVHPTYERLMFMAGSATTPFFFRKKGTANARLARSQDGGRSWEILTEGFPEHIQGSIEALTMETCGTSYRLYAGTTEGAIFYSDSELAGRRWRQIISELPPISKYGHAEMIKEGAPNFSA